MMKWTIYFLPVLAGVAMSTQAVVNGQLRSAVGNPFLAALVSLFIGTLALLLLTFLVQPSLPSIKTIQDMEWIKFTGGLLGAFFVTSIILSVQNIPSANMFALIVTGQLITALLFDHFGFLGIRQIPITQPKVAGTILLIIGAYIINKK
jgi:transporter family-2 protein